MIESPSEPLSLHTDAPIMPNLVPAATRSHQEQPFDDLEVLPAVSTGSDGRGGSITSSQADDFNEFNRGNPAQLYLASLHSHVSAKSMKSRLNQFASWTGALSIDSCTWSAMRAPHIVAFLKWYEQGVDAERTQGKDGRRLGSTVNTTLCALRGVAKHAWLCGQITEEDYAKIRAVKPVRYSRLPAGRELTKTETFRIQNGLASNKPADIRDLAMILLMVGCGLRRAEIPLLRCENYNPETLELTLVGKGDKERKVFLPPVVRDALDAWIHEVRGDEPGFLFGRIRKNGRYEPKQPLNADSVGWIFKRTLLRLGIDAATPHDLRRTFAGRLMDNGVDLSTIQKLMGHANVSTTARYDRRGEDRQRNAMMEIEV